MSVSANDLLDAVNSAISQIASGVQSVTVDGQSFTLASIDGLFKIKRSLEAEISQAQAQAAGYGVGINITNARFRN